MLYDMIRLLVSTICATVMYIAAYGQGGRIVCDESCREEYLKTQASASVSPPSKMMTIRSAPLMS